MRLQDVSQTEVLHHAYRYGIDLFNAGYYWESQETKALEVFPIRPVAIREAIRKALAISKA